MFEFEGAPLKDAFSILGDGSKKSKKEKNKENPRDEEPNKLNHINFEENMKFVVERYDKVINNLISEINSVKEKLYEKQKTSNNLFEGYSNKVSKLLSEEQINEIIFLIFSGLFIIIIMNYLCKK
tara:strand:+ start:115 stop:489 length:375 start_codon:yes stop_codon:yes gene_type:complete